jgi:hypothetical protein
MNKEIDDGGPAYPNVSLDHHGFVGRDTGLTKREWFAGMAVQGILADGETGTKDLVPRAYRIADAMIAAGKVKS